MSVIEFKIPNDPEVMRAVAGYLQREAEFELQIERGMTEQPDWKAGEPFDHSKYRHAGAEEGPGENTDFEPTPVTEAAPVTMADGEVVLVDPVPGLDPRGSEAAPAPTDTGVQLDKTGLPWDGRIHASSKALLQDQTWRKKRGVADFLVTQVEAELRDAMAAPAPALTATEAALVPGTQTTSQAEAPPPTDAAAAFGDTAPARTLADLLTKITQAAIPMDKVLAVLNAKGIAALPLLDSRPDLIPEVAAELGLQ